MMHPLEDETSQGAVTLKVRVVGSRLVLVWFPDLIPDRDCAEQNEYVESLRHHATKKVVDDERRHESLSNHPEYCSEKPKAGALDDDRHWLHSPGRFDHPEENAEDHEVGVPDHEIRVVEHHPHDHEECDAEKVLGLRMGMVGVIKLTLRS